MALLTTADVILFDADADRGQVDELVSEVCALARARVPALADEAALSPDQAAAVKGRLRTAVLRYLDAGDGSIVTQTDSAPAGYSHSQTVHSTRRGGILTDYDVEELLKILGDSARRGSGAAFSLARSGLSRTAGHDDGCGVFWGAACDCTVAFPLDSPVSLGWPWAWVP